jgi:hypothetical protein
MQQHSQVCFPTSIHGTILPGRASERGNRELTLERRDGRQVSPELWAEARYPLAVEPDCRVTLPADALWALSLATTSPARRSRFAWRPS